ncbi:hypothetical protein TNCV_4265451 [Trichonephila clavipes]|nr:hypothetical protein TNCV_4265451 [Trichonephila clavipes]
MCIKLKNDIPVCQRTRRLSCSDNPSPMKSKYRRPCLFRLLYVSDSPLVSMKKGKKGRTAADKVQSGWPLWHAAKSQKTVFARRRKAK